MNDVFKSQNHKTLQNEDEYDHGILKTEKDCSHFITLLIKEDLKDEQSLSKIIECLCRYLKEHQRLLYSVITMELYALNKKEETAVLLEKSLENSKILISLDNDKLKDILAKLEINIEVNTEMNRLNVIFLKLYDHVNLAMSQLTAIDEVEDEIKTSITKHADDTKNQLDSHMEKIKLDIVSVQKEIKDTKKEIKDTQKDYITILGIFAAIMLTFISALVFNSSVLENMHKSGIYKITYVAIMIIQGTIHLVYLLIDFIYRLYKEEKYPYPQWLETFNFCALIAFVLSLVATLS